MKNWWDVDSEIKFSVFQFVFIAIGCFSNCFIFTYETTAILRSMFVFCICWCIFCCFLRKSAWSKFTSKHTTFLLHQNCDKILLYVAAIHATCLISEKATDQSEYYHNYVSLYQSVSWSSNINSDCSIVHEIISHYKNCWVYF